MRAPRGPVDLPARLLEVGLMLMIFAVPAPLGAVGPRGRLLLELGALALLALWSVRACLHPTVLPAWPIRLGALGLVGLALLQVVPLGEAVVSRVSPNASAIRAASAPPPAAWDAEVRLIGHEIAGLRAPATLSVDPGAGASALRTGVALAALLLVGTTVAAVCGIRGLALAFLLTAGFQGLYGVLVLASENPHIWNVPKLSYLDSATGTFVNRNHFACFLAMALSCGLGLILDGVRRIQLGARRPWRWFRGDNSRPLLLGLFLIVGLAGLLASFSRAGILLGLTALLVTGLAAGRFQGVRARLVVAALVLAAACVPLAQIGSERLIQRYLVSAEDLVTRGGRAEVWRDTLELAAAFPLTGSGFGTFAAVYPVYRSPDVRLFYAHAHNDLLQFAAEGGLLGAVLLALVLVPVLATTVRALSGACGTVAVGCAAGLIAILLHSLVDFNFHIPANAATAALLAGALQGMARARPPVPTGAEA